jgi:hypothetical protein
MHLRARGQVSTIPFMTSPPEAVGVSASSSTQMCNQVFFEVHDLEPILHTLLITFVGEVNQLPLIMQSFRIENVPPSLVSASLPPISTSPTSFPSSSSAPPPASPGVGAGVIAGAVVAAIVALHLLVALILYKYRRWRSRRINEAADTTVRAYGLYSLTALSSSPRTAKSRSTLVHESVSGQSLQASSLPGTSPATRPRRDVDSGWRSNPVPVQEDAVVLPPVYAER